MRFALSTITSPPRALTGILITLLLSSAVWANGSRERADTRIAMIEAEEPGYVPFFLAPTATFQASRVVHRVKHNNKWWMRIHVKFRIKNALSTPCKVYAYFYDDTDGEPLGAGDDYPKYATRAGNVYTALDFTPSLDDAQYNDLQLYIPYEALNLETEKGSEYDLKYFFTMRDELTSREFAKSSWYKFSLRY